MAALILAAVFRKELIQFLKLFWKGMVVVVMVVVLVVEETPSSLV